LEEEPGKGGVKKERAGRGKEEEKRESWERGREGRKT